MPWPNFLNDVEVAFEHTDYDTKLERFEATIIPPPSMDREDAWARVMRMMRALSKFSKKCDWAPGKCHAQLFFIPGHQGKLIPFRCVMSADARVIVIRNHFRDCPSLQKNKPAPRPTQPVSPPQGSLFDLSPGPRPGQKEYPD